MRKRIASLCSIFLLILSGSFVLGEELEVRVLHVNDFHGFAEPYQPLGSHEQLGGVAYLAGKVKELRKERRSLLLSAGDMIQGSHWTNLFQGRSVIELMNVMGFDAMVLGNHEFDYGQEVLKQRISEATFPILAANVAGLDSLKPYEIKELEGVRFGIVGVITEELSASTHPKNLDGLRFTPPIETAQKYVEELRHRVDVIILLSHIGYLADRMLAEKVKGIDVIVGGHSHTKITSPVRIGDTLIVQAWEHGKALGVLDLTIENGKIIRFKGYLEEIKPEMGREAPTVSEIVKKYREKVDGILNETVGVVEVDLDGENVRRRETNLGNLIADVMRQVAKAEVAILNGGGIRRSIKKGEVRLKDIYAALPFDNYIVAIKLRGKEIQEVLEHGVSAVEDEAGQFPQVSGLTFQYCRSEQRGARVKEILVARKPLNPEQEYSVAINDFMAVGGDGYKAFGDAVKRSKGFSIIGGVVKGETLVYSDSSRWVRDVVAEYIREKGKVAPTVEGRIQEIR